MPTKPDSTKATPIVRGRSAHPNRSEFTTVSVTKTDGDKQIYHVPNRMLQNGNRYICIDGHNYHVKSLKDDPPLGSNPIPTQRSEPSIVSLTLQDLPEDSDDPQIELLRTLMEAMEFIDDISAKGFFGKLITKNQIREKFTTFNDRLAFLMPALVLSLQADIKEDLGKSLVEMAGNNTVMFNS